MKQLGLLTIAGLALMSFIMSAEATTTPDPNICTADLEFTKLAWNDIAISWTNCFSENTNYDIYLIGNLDAGDIYCNKTSYECIADSKCEMNKAGMNCINNNPILPCSSVTYTVVGIMPEEEPLSVNTTVPPWFRNANDWQLSANLDETESFVVVTWGPPSNNENYINCAIKAKVTATCTGSDDSELEIPKVIEDINPQEAYKYEIPIDNCIRGNDISVTVIYMSGELPTETKNEIMVPYQQDTTTSAGTTTDTTTSAGSTTDATTSAGSTTDATTSAGSTTDPNHISEVAIAFIVIGSMAGFFK